jgi:hypothetical protein
MAKLIPTGKEDQISTKAKFTPTGKERKTKKSAGPPNKYG